ncbi:adenylosuccinate lyase [Pseudalkalibacillus sp. A8]|uniref:adenylosuccinate lyase n=1 Tax=Pseudalkalibacillus sp. A8 TaxID=3382641 RepID=UPI0038B5982D
MASAVYDSILFKHLFSTEKMREIFSEKNLVQKWLDVEAALARAEAKLGIIPQEASDEINSKAKVELMDLEEMGKEIKGISHPIVPLVRQLTNRCENGLGQYVHWGATTQDIMDSANVLQIREVVEVVEEDIKEIQVALVELIKKHRNTVMPGRTHGQHGLPITFGYKAAVWLEEMNRNAERLEEIKDRLFTGQFSGAVGTFASIKEKGLELQEEIMKELKLNNPLVSWHASRDTFTEFASFLAILTHTLAKIANEVVHLQKTEFGELEEPFSKGKVGSSTMPHKRNPSKTQNIVTISRTIRQNVPVFLEGMIHQHERDMISWQTEWETLPEVCMLAGSALSSSIDVLRGLIVNEDRMKQNLDLTNGLIMSESIMISLGETLGRQVAHDLVYDACMEAFEQNRPLQELLSEKEEIKQNLSEEAVQKLFDYASYVGYSVDYADRVVAKTEELLSAAAC